MYSVAPPAHDRQGYYYWLESLRRIVQARNERRSLINEVYAEALLAQTQRRHPTPTALRDFDGDGLPDHRDRDDDNDGVADTLDVAPYNASVTAYAAGEGAYRSIGEGTQYGALLDLWA